MKQTLHIEMDVELFDLTDIKKVEAQAKETNGTIYTWKTIGRANWLDQGASNVDALGLVIIPRSPDRIKMSEDVLDADDE